jgi:hypothetical protein
MNTRTLEPVAWGMPRSDGLILDVICPEEHARCAGEYTVPLYTMPQPFTEPQQPVAWIYEFYADPGHPALDFEPQPSAHNTPLYLAPQPQPDAASIRNAALEEAAQLAEYDPDAGFKLVQAIRALKDNA